MAPGSFDISYDDTPGSGGFAIRSGSGGGVESGRAVVPEPQERWHEDTPEFPHRYMRIHGADVRAILDEDDPAKLKEFLMDNVDAINWGKEIRDDLANVIIKHAPPGANIVEEMNPKVLLKYLEDILDRYQRKFALFDISLEGSQLLEGTALQMKIDASRQKIYELLESYQHRLNEAELNVQYLDEILAENNALIKAYEDRIGLLYNQILALKGRVGMFVEEPTQDYFFSQLREHLEKDLHLNSTFREELAAEKRTKHSLFQEICRLKEQRIYDEQQRMADIAEMAKDLELDEGIRRAIVDKIMTLTARPDEIHTAVNDWMTEIRFVINAKETSIQQMKDDIKLVEDRLAAVTAERNDRIEKYQQLQGKMAELDAEIDKKVDIYNAKSGKIEELDWSIQDIVSRIRYLTHRYNLSQTRYQSARSRLSQLEESMLESAETSGTPSTYETPEISGQRPQFRPTISGGTPGLRHSTPQARRRLPFQDTLSPLRSPHPVSRIQSPKSPQTPKSVSFSFKESPEKPRLGSPYRGAATYFDDSESLSIDSTPRSPLSPYSISPPSPMNVPSPLMPSFEGREPVVELPGTVEIPRPLSKFAPITGTIDPSTECRVSNRFDIGKSFSMHTVCQTSTPYQQVTRVLSHTPGSGFSGQMINYPLSISHSAVLTPTRYETPFISKSRFGYTDPTARMLNVPPGLALRTPLQDQGVSPDVETFGTPPAVTPTTTRRHGLFTPTGIFRKRHYNIRRLYDPEDYESPTIPWSPQYLPEDSRSPVSSLSSSPRYGGIMDETFEGSPVLDRTFDPTASRAMNRTFEASPQYIRDRTFDASPQHIQNRTFGSASPLPTDRTLSPQDLNRKFYASPQYIQNRTFDASPQYIQNRTFDASPQYIQNRTFDASPQYIQNRTFDASPQYIQNRTFDASPQYIQNRTFDASSPLSRDRTFDTASPPAINRTFDAASPPAINRTFDALSPHNLNRTYGAVSMDKTFETSPKYIMDRTFNDAQTSPSRRTLQESQSPVLDKTFDKNATFASNRSFNESHSPERSRSPSTYQSYDLD